MSQRHFLALLMILIIAGPAVAERRPVNVAVWYPFSLNRSGDVEVNLNLSLLRGEVGRVDGLDLAGLGSVVRDEMNGIQLTGLAGVVGGDMQGLQIAGLASVVGENAWGIQSSGLANVVGLDFSGLQTAGLANVVGEGLKGFQSAGFANVTGTWLTGIQISGFANVVGTELSGFQATGFANIVGSDLFGLQVGGFANVVGGELTGAQVGPINVAGEARGLQIGIVNIAGEQHGVPIGLINRADDENIDYLMYGSSLGAINVGVQFEVNRWTSMLSLGAVNLSESIDESLIAAWHFGRRMPLGNYDLTFDLGIVNIDNDKLFSDEGEDGRGLQARAFAAWRGSESFGAFIGGGITRFYDHDWDLEETEPLFFAGVSYRR